MIRDHKERLAYKVKAEKKDKDIGLFKYLDGLNVHAKITYLALSQLLSQEYYVQLGIPDKLLREITGITTNKKLNQALTTLKEKNLVEVIDGPRYIHFYKLKGGE